MNYAVMDRSGVSSRFKSVIGWERYGDHLLLRMKFSQPELRRVWPGAPSASKPEGEVRLLYDELLSYDDVKSAVIESTQVPHGQYSAADLRLLAKALGEIRLPTLCEPAIEAAI